MAARSCKETADVWGPRPSSGKKRGHPPARRGSTCVHLLLGPALRTRTAAAGDGCQVTLSIRRWSGRLSESLTCSMLCKGFRALTLSWSPARRSWVAAAAAVRSS